METNWDTLSLVLCQSCSDAFRADFLPCGLEMGAAVAKRYRQGSRMSLAGDDPEHVVVVPGGLFAPTAKAGLTAAIAGDEVEGDFA